MHISVSEPTNPPQSDYAPPTAPPIPVIIYNGNLVLAAGVKYSIRFAEAMMLCAITAKPQSRVMAASRRSNSCRNSSRCSSVASRGTVSGSARRTSHLANGSGI